MFEHRNCIMCHRIYAKLVKVSNSLLIVFNTKSGSYTQFSVLFYIENYSSVTCEVTGPCLDIVMVN